MGDDEMGLVEGLDDDSSSSSSSGGCRQTGLDLERGNIPKEVGSIDASCATEETAPDESTSDSFGISSDDNNNNDDDDDISQSTPIAMPNLSSQKQSAGVGAVAVAGAASHQYRYTVGPSTKTCKGGTNAGGPTAVVFASSSNARMVPCDRFISEEATEHMNEAPPQLQQDLEHPDNGGGDDGNNEVDGHDQRTVSSGSSSGSSWLDAHFARRFERGPTPPRISSRDLAGRRIIEAEQEGADNVPERFAVAIPGAYSVQQGGDRSANDDSEIFEVTSSVYRLAEAAVVDDDVIVDARPVNEANESNLMEQMAEMERRYSLASQALEVAVRDREDREDRDNREKGRRHRTVFWVALICAVSAILITIVVVTTSKTSMATNNIESTAGEGSSSNASSTASDDDLPSSGMLSLRNIVGGGFSDFDSDPNRLAALDWMSRDQISISLMRSASGDDASEGEHVRKLRQRYVSALLFLATDGPSWYARLGFLSSKNECDWNRAILGDESVGEVTDFGGALEVKGLFCNEQGRIQRISIWWNGLAGTIPSEVSFLSDSLEGINISGGSISGTIPPSFGDLKELKELSISEQCLSGTLPESISSLNRLEILNLHGNDNLSGSLNKLCKTNNVSWFAADCGDCPGSEARIQCDCCVCCESSSFSCCDKEGGKLYEWMNLAENPITNLPLSLDRPCLSEEAMQWREEECPCVVYGKGGGICSTECNDDKTLLQEALEEETNNSP